MPSHPKDTTTIMDASEDFKLGRNSISMLFPSPKNYSKSSNVLTDGTSHDDDISGDTTNTKYTTANTLGNLEQQQQEQQQVQQFRSSAATPLFAWSKNLANDSDVWEPYPLNLPPTSYEQELTSEALQEFLDLAIHRDETTSSNNTPHEPRGREESTDKDDKQQDIMSNKSPIIESSASTSATITDNKDQEESQQSLQQKQRESIADFLSVDYTKVPRIRDYQEQQWEKHYMNLVEFHQREGHCCVPNKSQQHAGLARWVKRQRYQYKLRQQGVTKSTMVPHRMQALERLGFVWDSHAALWEEQLHSLKAFCMMHGHCDVPSVFPANPQLSTWVKRQRRLYRENSMTKSRQEKLNEIGFDWKTR